MEHTPGPWFWNEEGLGNKNHIVFGREYPINMTSKANKALITAAPELLDALISMVDAATTWNSSSYAEKLSRVKKARAAIAKAIGKEE